CDMAGVDLAITTGGPATFNCAAPTLVTLTKTYTLTANPQLDGGNFLSLTVAGNKQLFDIPSGRTLSLANLTVKGVSQSMGAGSVASVKAGGALIANGVTFSGNAANGGLSGGVISSQGAVTITNSTLISNTATSEGGAIATLAGTLSIDGSSFL